MTQNLSIIIYRQKICNIPNTMSKKNMNEALKAHPHEDYSNYDSPFLYDSATTATNFRRFQIWINLFLVHTH